MAFRTLYLIRHGQYDTTVNSADGGSLTDLGKKQAEYVAQALKEVSVTKIYASTMVRAIETGNIIAQTSSHHYSVSELLREVIPSIPPRIATLVFQMMATNPRITHESIHDDQQRADKAFDQFFIPPEGEEDTNDILACHGNLIRYLTCKALGVNTDTWAKLLINHCSITTVTIDSNGLMNLQSYNETGHIPQNIRTE